MASAPWPAGLPQFVAEAGYSEQLAEQVQESPVDAGPPKTRRRFTRGWRTIAATIHCTAEQAALFEAFFRDDLFDGTLPFVWVNPISQAPALMRFRKPAPQFSVFGGENVAIRMNLHQMALLTDFHFDSTLISFDSTAKTFDQADGY